MAGDSAVFAYKITEDGGPTVTDRNTYPSLGEQTFTKTQKYRIAVQGDGDKPFHFLVAKTTEKVGSKVVGSNPAATYPISDGFFVFECKHYYSEKLGKSVDDVDNPSCEIVPIGAIVPNARAERIGASGK